MTPISLPYSLLRVSTVVLIATLWLSGFLRAQDIETSSPTNQPDIATWIDSWATKKMAEEHMPGATIAIVQSGKIIFEKGYGFSDIGKQSPVDPKKSLFRVGSISKLFTHTATMQLYEQGLLDLDTDVNRYLKDMQLENAFGQSVTIRHLMSHTAGFENNILRFNFQGNPSITPTVIEYLDDPKYREKRVAPPGVRQSYSNYGVSLLGHVIEQVTGMPFVDYIEKNIMHPLGMYGSSFREARTDGRFNPMPQQLVPDVATGYVLSKGEMIPIPNEYIYPAAAPAGSLFANAHDMATFMKAYLAQGAIPGSNKRLLQPDTISRMHAQTLPGGPDTGRFTYGFFNRRINGYETYGHGGGMAGFKSHLLLIPEADLGIFISINSGSVAPGSFSYDLIKYLLPRKAVSNQPAKLPNQTTQQLAEKIEGRYMSDTRPYTTLEKLTSLNKRESYAEVDNNGYLLLKNRTWAHTGPLQFTATDNADDIIRFELN